MATATAEPPTKQTNEGAVASTAAWMDSIKNIQVTSESGAQSEPPPKPEPPPAAVKVEPKVETAPVKPEPPSEPEDAKWPRTSADWKKFREARDKEKQTYETKLKEYETKVAELSKQPTAPADYEAIKKQAEEYSGIIQQISVENHPKFRAYYDGAVTKQVELAKQIVGSELSDTVTEVLSMPDGKMKNEKIDELFTTLSPSQQARLGGVVNQISNIQLERSNEVKKSKETFAALEKQKADEQANRAKNMESLFESEIKKIHSDNPAYKKRDGDEEWNADVDRRSADLKNILFGGNIKPEQMIHAAADAMAMPVVLKQNLALQEQVKTLEAQVAELSSASPKIATDKSEASAASGEKAEAKAPAGSRPMDLLAAQWMKNLPNLGR